MISKKKFKQYIEFLKNYEDKLTKANEVLYKISTEFTGISGIASPIIDQYVYMLTDLMELTNVDKDLLWWWIYEQDFGMRTSQVSIGDKAYLLKTPEDLYDFIIKIVENYKKKQEKKNGKKVS